MSVERVSPLSRGSGIGVDSGREDLRVCYGHVPHRTSRSENARTAMDNSLTLARYFARLVWLLIHESQSVNEQKVALRAVAFVSREVSVRLGLKEGRLAVNKLVMPQALTGVQELAERMVVHTITEIEIDEQAKPAELLALARLLSIGAASTSDAADFAQKLSQLQGVTVHVRLAEVSVPTPVRTSDGVAVVDAVPAPDENRLTQLFGKLSAAADSFGTNAVLEEIGFVMEQSTREGRISDTADIFTELLDRESRISDPELRRAYLVMVRRFTKSVYLRPIAALLASSPERAKQIERVLQRCGQDGIDAVVDQYIVASALSARRLFREVLFRMTGAVDALVQMLSDPRWHVVRQAAEFLGDLRAQDAEPALADQLRHQDVRVRRAVTRALARSDSVFSLDALSRAIVDEAAAVRLEAVAALAGRKGARAAALLSQAIDDESDQEVQYAILGGLGRVGSPDAVQKLAKAAEAASGLFKSKKNTGLRAAAVQALADARTPAALQALQALAGDKEREVRDAVARALQSSRSSAA